MSPVHAEWLHDYVITPLEEGLRRINLAWAGRNIYSLNRTPLSLEDRAIALVTGFALCLFPINTIIWIAWQTFGHPKRLFERYSPQIETPITPPPIPQAETLSPAAAFEPELQEGASAAASLPELPASVGQAVVSAAIRQEEERDVQMFSFNETGSRGMIRTNWKVVSSPNQILTHKHCDEYASTSVYDPNWALKEFHHYTTEKNKQFDLWILDSKTAKVRILANGVEITKDDLELQPNLPVIQQPIFGLREFALKEKIEFPFCSIISENRSWCPSLSTPPYVMRMVAKKAGMEVVAGVDCFKVEVVSEWRWPYNPGKGEFFFDKDGVLRKFSNPLENSIGEYLSSGP